MDYIENAITLAGKNVDYWNDSINAARIAGGDKEFSKKRLSKWCSAHLRALNHWHMKRRFKYSRRLP